MNEERRQPPEGPMSPLAVEKSIVGFSPSARLKASSYFERLCDIAIVFHLPSLRIAFELVALKGTLAELWGRKLESGPFGSAEVGQKHASWVPMTWTKRFQ